MSTGNERVPALWTQVPIDTPVADVLGLSFIAIDEAWSSVVFDVRAHKGRDDVAVIRCGSLGSKELPLRIQVPLLRRLDDVMAEYRKLHISRIVRVPIIRWPGHLTTSAPVPIAGMALGVPLVLLLGPTGPYAWIAAVVWGAALIAVVLGLQRWGPATAIAASDGSGPFRDDHVHAMVLRAIPASPPSSLAIGTVGAPVTRAEAEARVAQLKAKYDGLLSDLVYRIENAALFDPAVRQTREFTLLLARWDDEHARLPGDEAATLARELALSFDTARAHAESVGLAHLPTGSRTEAGRAVKAVHLARGASTDGERAAAIGQVNRILASLALYYLPDPVETRQALTGSRPQLGPG